MSKVLTRQCYMCMQTVNARTIHNQRLKSITNIAKKCIIYTTNTTNPYQNLAFEDWMYERVDFTKTSCLFIWRNEPSVVIGRHQNPWKECHIKELLNHDVHLCRRKSGGGAVYHDLGNINFTFFTDKQNYNRKKNLEIIIEGLKSKWPELDVSINSRDDIVLKFKEETFKISGSSAKLGRINAYHHCTLLLNSEKSNIQKFLMPSLTNLTCNSTDSVRSKVANLCDVDNSISFTPLCNAVKSAYADKYISNNVYQIATDDTNLFPGILKTEAELKSWDWILGKTPKFAANKCFFDELFGEIEISISIEKGILKNIKIQSISNDKNTMETFSRIASELQDCKFHPINIQKIFDNISSSNDDSCFTAFVLKCIKEMI